MSYLEISKAAMRRIRARRELNQIVEPLSDPRSESRRQRLLLKLKKNPQLRYAVEAECLDDGSYVIAFAIPEATFEIVVPVPRDPFEFFGGLIEAAQSAGAANAKKAKEAK